MVWCKTPELVRKELWARDLARNSIQAIAAQAATRHGVEPRSISFTAVAQAKGAFQPAMAIRGGHDAAIRRELCQ